MKRTSIFLCIVLIAGISLFVVMRPGYLLTIGAAEKSAGEIKAEAQEYQGPRAIIGAETIPVEVMRTKEEVARGLSGRAALTKGTGMLFLFEASGIYRFWMKDMKFPIDIIWLDKEKRVVHIVPRAPPLQEGNPPVFYASEKPAQYVLEVNAGDAARFRITLGMRVDFVGIK